MEHEITVGERNFTFYTLKPFDAIKHGARLKGAFTKGVSADGLEASAIQLIAGLDENFVPNIVMPILKDCAVVCTSAERKVVSEADVNAIYTVEDLDEFFILIGKVLGANFGPALKKTLARFGIQSDKFDLKSLIAKLSKSSSMSTSPTR